jgi:GT2 family glycosyltransferase/glycosyltransferase involved in cell wall biosynthesis
VQRRPLCIVIPFYRDPSLPSQVLQSLRSCADELRRLQCTVVAVNDAPGYPAFDSLLRAELDQLHPFTPCRLIRNTENLGFLKSANLGLGEALSQGSDCILLNSDTVVFSGALEELQSAAYSDAAIGFASPRSNNATICSLPHQHREIEQSPEEAYAAYRRLEPFLPRVQIAPTAVGFCLYVKYDVLRECGIFDEIYGRGYNEENDLVMRANRMGYCAAIANRAFVYHRGNVSFSEEARSLESHNAGILDSRYPEYRPSVNTYFLGIQYRAELLLSTLVPSGPELRLGIIGDAREELVRRFPKLSENYEVLHRSSLENGDTSAAIVIVNPSWQVAAQAATLAPVNIFVLTDIGPFDRLDSRSDTERAWRLMFDTADAVCAQDPSRFLLRLPLQQTIEPVDALPDVVDKAIAKCSTIRIAKRLAILDSPYIAACHSDEIHRKDRRIRELEASLSWRATAPLRRVAELLGVRPHSETVGSGRQDKVSFPAQWVRMSRRTALGPGGSDPEPSSNQPPLLRWESQTEILADDGCAESREQPGLNIIGYLRSEMGTGEASRCAAAAASAAGISTCLVNFDAGVLSRRKDYRAGPLADEPRYRINLFNVNADQTHVLQSNAVGEMFDGRYNIGYWVWELEEFPNQFVPAFDVYDEIWVPSTFCQEAIACKSPVPVVRIPHAIQVEPSEARMRGELGLGPDRFAFLCMFDVLSVVQRKNPLGVIEAFRLALPRLPPDAVLVMKINNGSLDARAVSELRQRCEGLPVVFIDSTMSRADVNALLASCDCLVSLHRSEGFGLSIAEAMHLGKPVIVTAYSGNMDFTKHDNSLLVPYRMAPVGPGAGPYDAGSVWAEPDVKAAAEHMVAVTTNDSWRAAVARRGCDFVREHLCPKAVGGLMKARLTEIWGWIGRQNG